METYEIPLELEKLVTQIAERTAAKVSEKLAFPRWMKLKDAMHYSSYSRAQLLKLAKEKVIAGRPDPNSKRGDWRFDKKSIDEYMISQIVGERHRTLSIIESLKKP